MNASLISFIARGFSWLPLRWNRATGTLLARVMWALNTRARQITQVNLRLCFPDLTEQQRNSLARESLRQTGQLLTECTWIWHRPNRFALDHIRDIVGETLLNDALDSPRGLIVVSPHMGNWEVCSLAVSSRTELTYFYRSPRQTALEPLLLKWRAHIGGRPATLDAGGIRHGLKLLKQGGTLGILPDQEPDRENGVFAPFFNVPALTMTLLPRLAARSNAQVIFTVAERLEAEQGWRLHFLAANPAIYSRDPVESAQALNSDVERCIDICQAQYLWDYKRFSSLENGERRSYSCPRGERH